MSLTPRQWAILIDVAERTVKELRKESQSRFLPKFRRKEKVLEELEQWEAILKKLKGECQDEGNSSD